jgi:hypothetical protein
MEPVLGCVLKFFAGSMDFFLPTVGFVSVLLYVYFSFSFSSDILNREFGNPFSKFHRAVGVPQLGQRLTFFI